MLPVADGLGAFGTVPPAVMAMMVFIVVMMVMMVMFVSVRPFRRRRSPIEYRRIPNGFLRRPDLHGHIGQRSVHRRSLANEFPNESAQREECCKLTAK